jgi:hypothetical protein
VVFLIFLEPVFNRVIRVHSGTVREGSDLAVYHRNRNIVWYAFKNFPREILLTSLPWIIGRNIGMIPYYAVRGQGLVILRAKLDAVKGLLYMGGEAGRNKKNVANREIVRWVRTWGFEFCAMKR